jgi:uncharacterized protein YkwD
MPKIVVVEEEFNKLDVDVRYQDEYVISNTAMLKHFRNSRKVKSCVVYRQCAVLVFLVVIACSCEEDDPDYSKEQLRTLFLQEINLLRSQGCQCGQDQMPPVPALTWNDLLAQAAEQHATDMHDNNYFDHLSQDGTPPFARVQLTGYDPSYVGEDIAQGYVSVQGVVKGWRESESHCKAMMDTTFQEMGAAKIADYWVLDLARPK